MVQFDYTGLFSDMSKIKFDATHQREISKVKTSITQIQIECYILKRQSHLPRADDLKVASLPQVDKTFDKEQI